MRRTLFGLSALAVVALAGTIVWHAGAGAPAASDHSGLLKLDADYIHETLKKESVDKKSQNRMRMAALMVAVYAEHAMSKDAKRKQAMATLRDVALKLCKAAEAEKYDEARALAKSLSLDIAPDAAAKTEPAKDLDKYLEREYLMRMFSATRVGGFGLEKVLEELVDLEGAVDSEAAANIQAVAMKTAMIAVVAEHYAPRQDQGNMTKKAWLDFCKDTRKDAVALTEAGKTKNDAAIRKAAQKLSTSCVNCHDVFR